MPANAAAVVGRPGARVAVLLALLACAPPRSARADGGDAWFGSDKALHFGLSAGIATTTYAATMPLFAARYAPLLVGAGATLAVGAGKEIYDATGAGDPSWKDFTWDAIGMVAGLAVAYGLDLALRGDGPEHPFLGPPRTPGASSTPFALAPLSAAGARRGGGLVVFSF